MDWIPAPKRTPKAGSRQNSGIALFMVLGAISVLSVTVTEFRYISAVTQELAYSGAFQVKAHYLAKSGFKLSLLRLKAYSEIKRAMKAMGGGKGLGISQSVMDKIWSFPFFYPIPADLPGLSLTQKDAITKFQKDSGLEGRFQAIIESEGSKYNLNSLHSAFAFTPSPSPSPSAGGTPPSSDANPPADPSPTPGGGPAPNPSASPFSSEAAREALAEYMRGILANKIENDRDFADEYKDFRLDDFLDGLYAFADRLYERKLSPPNDIPAQKGGAFVHISELRMIPGMDDKLYDLFAPGLTVAPTAGINVNSMKEPTLKALIPGIKPEEIVEFFKFRDSQEQDNTFKSVDDFFSALSSTVESVGKGGVEALKKELEKKKVRLVIDETQFKVTVKATVENATRLIEAYVTLTDPKTSTPPTPGAGSPPQSGAQTQTSLKPDPGLKITYMRIL